MCAEKRERRHTINNGGDYCGAVVCFTSGPASKRLSLVQGTRTMRGGVRRHGQPALRVCSSGSSAGFPVEMLERFPCSENPVTSIMSASVSKPNIFVTVCTA